MYLVVGLVNDNGMFECYFSNFSKHFLVCPKQKLARHIWDCITVVFSHHHRVLMQGQAELSHSHCLEQQWEKPLHPPSPSQGQTPAKVAPSSSAQSLGG